MDIHRKTIKLEEEKRILTCMIVSTEFLKLTYKTIRPQLFKNSYVRIVSRWVLQYMEGTQQAPMKDIEDIYKRQRKTVTTEEELEIIRMFIQNLSNEWKQEQEVNVPYEVKNCTEYIRKRSLEVLKEDLEEHLLEGTINEAENRVADFIKVRGQQSSSVDILRDTDKVVNAFRENNEALFTYPGAMGEAIGAVNRGDFMAILGAPKSGKTFCLLFTAFQAAMLGLKVFVANFEMTESAYIRRTWQMIQGQPRTKKKIILPRFVPEKEGDKSTIRYYEKECEGINIADIRKQQKSHKIHIGSGAGNIHVQSFIQGASTLSDVVSALENLEHYNNYRPDMIVFDYPDIMAPELHADKRHQLDDIWIKIRGLAQKNNCICVVASQVNSIAWEKDIHGKHVDENKKKVAHITKMFAINSTEEQIKKGYTRVHVLYNREGAVSHDQVVVLHGFSIGRFYLDSRFLEDFTGNSD